MIPNSCSWLRHCSHVNCLKVAVPYFSVNRSSSIHGSPSAAESRIDGESQPGHEDALTHPSRRVEREKLAKWKSLRDISKLSRYHRMKLTGEVIPPDMFKWQSEKWALRQRYAEYGQASGVNPATLWPTKDELDEMRATDDELNPDFFKARQAVLAAKAEEASLRKEKMELVAKNLKKYKKAVAAHRAKLEEHQNELLEIEQKKEQQVKEIQEYFGYAVDPTDPRFQAMLARKEAEERKARKIALKQEQNQKLIAQLTESTMAIKDNQKI